MRTTLDIPRDLIERAMAITRAKSKSDLIKQALKNIIQQEKRNQLLLFHGQVQDLDLDLDSLRQR